MDCRDLEISLKPIGVVRSCFRKKFGIPRQPGLVPEATAAIELFPPYDNEQTLRGLEGFSHIWVLFIFHDSMEAEWKPTVRPPRLGGKKKVGVFASRSPFRPNPVGMSALELKKFGKEKGKTVLHVRGVDLLDGTPVIDIKPYIPYSDSIVEADGGYAGDEPEHKFAVSFSEEAQMECDELEGKGYAGLGSMAVSILRSDPRPAFYKPCHNRARFVLNLWDLDLEWKVEGDKIIIMKIIETAEREGAA